MLPLNYLRDIIQPLCPLWLWAGIVDVCKFIATHLISGMIPAFFIAGAIAVFLDKERISRLMGPKAKPLIAYSVSAFSGAILTVCSCGVLPIFTGILNQGAGIGPAFTFLFSAPAINLIALVYTYTFLGIGITLGRVFFVILAAIFIGVLMRFIFSEPAQEKASSVVVVPDENGRSDLKQMLFFFMLILVMITSTGLFDKYLRSDQIPINSPLIPSVFIVLIDVLMIKALLIFSEIVVIGLMLWRWFYYDEVIQWLKKSYSLFLMIFPKVIVGIFLSGLLTAVFPLTKFMAYFDHNTLLSNLIVAFLGSMMYFGTIVGVNIVATMVQYGMHPGPALTLLLSGPAVSLPSIIALTPIVGAKKSITYCMFVIIITALSGWIFGMIY